MGDRSFPVESSAREATTRVDAAHAAEPSAVPAAETPSRDLLAAIAGHDSQQVALQLRVQAQQLASLLRDKQKLLDQRESELNARTALLENELRASRLKRQLSTLVQSSAVYSEPSLESAGDAADPDDVSSLNAPSSERRAAVSPPPAFEDAGDPELDGSSPTEPTDRSVGRPTNDFGDRDRLDEQRHALHDRRSRLDARERYLEQVHDEVIDLHRESLEYRIATEQIWAQLAQHFSTDELSRHLSEFRQRITDHYQLANESLIRRRDELQQMRRELVDQEQRLRSQRREVQLWADRHYDEIEARTARMMARESELDQLESDLERQSLQWQQQRDAYRREIEELSWELRSEPASGHVLNAD